MADGLPSGGEGAPTPGTENTPALPDDYAVEFPELPGLAWNPEAQQAFLQTARTAGLTADQAKAVVQFYAERVTRGLHQQAKAQEAERARTLQDETRLEELRVRQFEKGFTAQEAAELRRLYQQRVARAQTR